MKKFYAATRTEGNAAGRQVTRSTERTYSHHWCTVVVENTGTEPYYQQPGQQVGAYRASGWAGSETLAQKAAQAAVNRANGANQGKLRVVAHIVPAHEITAQQAKAIKAQAKA